MNEWFAAFAVPAIGWVISVERRLQTIKVIDAKLDLLIEHLLPKKDEKAPPRANG